MSNSRLDVLMQETVDRLAALISQGTAEWARPWKMLQLGLHHQVSTREPYRGANQIILAIAAFLAGYTDTRWATYRGWQVRDAQVLAGSEGVRLIRWNSFYVCSDCGSAEKPVRSVADCGHTGSTHLTVPSAFTVFNAAQVTNAPALPPPPEVPFTPEEAAEILIESSGAEIVHADPTRAFYSPATERINLPPREAFSTAVGFYSTAFHELIHWTGHPSRLDRGQSTSFGSPEYASEELVAELGSALISANLGIEAEPHPEHAAYLASWLGSLREKPSRLYHAASDATRAADFLLKRVEAEVSEPAPDMAANRA